MSLIPAMLAQLSSRQSPVAPFATAGATTGYRPDTRSRPLAVLLAAGGPALLLVAYSLTPDRFIPDVEPGPTVISSYPVPPPPPPPDPDVVEKSPPKSVLTAPKPPFAPPKASEADVRVADPLILQPVGPVIPAIDPGPVVEPSPPLPPVRIAARLDSRYAGAFQPDYPLPELRAETAGASKVRVLVGTDGRVKAVEDAGSTTPGFFAETRKRALAKWRFKPATSDGTPVESWFIITVRFEVKDA